MAERVGTVSDPTCCVPLASARIERRKEALNVGSIPTTVYVKEESQVAQIRLSKAEIETTLSRVGAVPLREV